MRILNINSYYFSSSVHKQLQNALNKGEIDSITYVPLAKGYVPREECQYEKLEQVVVSECYNSLDRYIFHVKHYKILKDIKQSLDLKEFNCLHAHSLFSNGFIAMKIKKSLGIPYIVAVRDTDVNTFFKYMFHLRKLGIEILKEANKVIFLSNTYIDYLLKNYIPINMKQQIIKKSTVIPNGIDHFWLKNKGNPKQLPDKTIRLLYVGVISKRKNVKTTVKAVEILRSKAI